jgi:hypothetical protein
VLFEDPGGRILAARYGDKLAVERGGLAIDATTAGYVVRVVGDWRKLAPTPELKESLRLLDDRGRIVAQVDRPLGGEIDPFGGRPVGANATIRSALRAPPDLAGGKYAVRLVVYGPDGPLGPGWSVGEVELAAIERADPSLVAPARPDGRALGSGLRLLGDALPEAPVQAGSSVPVVLHWQALAANAFAAQLPTTRVALRGAPSGAPPEPPLVEGASRSVGGLLRDHRSLRVPRDLAPGRHDVLVRDGGTGAGELVLGSVQVVAAAPRPAVSPPQRVVDAAFVGVTLSGYDLGGDLRPGGQARVALHWRATDGLAADLTAFVHVVDSSGKPLAQHDGAPCGGECPTSGWAVGDELLDEHVVQLPATLAPGRYGLMVGLYHPATGARLARIGGPPEPADAARLAEIDVQR